MTTLPATASELGRWRHRMDELHLLIREAEEEEARLIEELAKVDAQAGYYESLAGDMKRDLQPPSLSRLLRSMRW